MKKRESLLLIDLGTSSIRVAVMDEDAHTFCFGKKPYHPNYLDELHIEQDPELWFSYLDTLMMAARDKLGGKTRVSAIVLTAQRSSVLPTDRDGKALRPAIMWQDKRHRDICTRIERDFPELQSLTGAMMNTAYSGPKMAWVKEHEPDIYARAFKLFTPAEFIIYRLTGEARTDYTYATRSLLFDIRNNRWSEHLLRGMGLDGAKLAEPLPPGSVVGQLLPVWAERWGLKAGLPLISAGGDQQCSALGLGVTAEGHYELTAGTGGYVMTLSHQLPKEFSGAAVNAAAIPGAYNYETTMITCSSAFDYFCRLLFPNKGYGEIGLAMRKAPPGAGGVLVLPFFQGSGSPDWAAEKKADVLGLSFSATAAEITLACLESIACEFAEHVRLLQRATGKKATELAVAGGLTQSEQFRRALAALADARLVRAQDFEAGLYGAYMSGAVALGMAPDFGTAHKRVARLFPTEEITTNDEDRAFYRTLLTRYQVAKAESHVTNRKGGYA